MYFLTRWTNRVVVRLKYVVGLQSIVCFVDTLLKFPGESSGPLFLIPKQHIAATDRNSILYARPKIREMLEHA